MPTLEVVPLPTGALPVSSGAAAPAADAAVVVTAVPLSHASQHAELLASLPGGARTAAKASDADGAAATAAMAAGGGGGADAPWEARQPEPSCDNASSSASSLREQRLQQRWAERRS